MIWQISQRFCKEGIRIDANHAPCWLLGCEMFGRLNADQANTGCSHSFKHGLFHDLFGDAVASSNELGIFSLSYCNICHLYFASRRVRATALPSTRISQICLRDY